MNRKLTKLAVPLIAGTMVFGAASAAFADEAGFHDFMMGGSGQGSAQAAPPDAATPAPTPDQPAPVRHRHFAHAKVIHYAAEKTLPRHLHARFREKNEKANSAS